MLSAAGRELGTLPPVADPWRKARATSDLEFFYRTYFPATFTLPFSEDHRTVIAAIKATVLHGGLNAIAMPRGSGKTTLCELGALWSILGGHRHYVFVIGADDGASETVLSSIKTELATNALLLADWPEVCYPVVAMEGITQRANGQTYQGQRTAIVWARNKLVFPTVPGSKASGSIIQTGGMTGSRTRGPRHKTEHGQTLRPDLALIDDPQTDQSARSPEQVEKREQIITRSILGMAGPGKKMSVFCACTVIQPEDLADRLLSPSIHPEWQGQRTKLCYQEPTDETLWAQYAELRRQGMESGDRGVMATEFYREHQEAMDAGAKPAWPERFNEDELSAIQHIMNLKIDNPLAYASEYQNDPVPDQKTAGAMRRDQVLAKLNGEKRGVVPPASECLAAMIDVHDDLLYWAVCAWTMDFSGAVIDYGTLPEQGESYFALRDAKRTLKQIAPPEAKSKQAAILAGLVNLGSSLLARKYMRPDKTTMQVGCLLIDAGYMPKIVDQALTQIALVRPHVAFASRGHAIKAAGRPMTEWKYKPGDRRGHYFGVFRRDQFRHRVFDMDVNQWKSRLRDGIAAAPGDPCSIGIYGASPVGHRLFADHLAAEYPTETQGRGRRVEEWGLRPAMDNHWMDCMVGCMVGGSFLGARMAGIVEAAPVRKRVKLSELQRQKRAG